MRTRWTTLVVVLAGACSPAVQEVEPTGEPIVYQGRVVAARGPTIPRTGDACTVEVVEADGSFLNCRIRVRCRGDLVYGLSGAGFNNCRRDGDTFVFAHDHSGTRGDGDPRMFFDLEAGRVIISDDDPDVEVLVDLLAEPEGYDTRGEDAPDAPTSGGELDAEASRGERALTEDEAPAP